MNIKLPEPKIFMSKILTSLFVITWIVMFQGAAVLFAQPPMVAPSVAPDATSEAVPKMTADFKGVRRAVLVGINEYQFLAQLSFAGADVEALGKSLTNAGFSERNVVIIHDKATRSLQPDKQKIMKQIELTLDSCGPDDLVFLVFCMHGVRIDGKTYLAPYEATPPRFDGDNKRLETFIPIDWVYEQLQNCPARMKLMMVDACQERIFDGDTRSLTAEQKRLQSLDDLESPKGVMQMVACAPGEYSYESEKLGHGVYTYFLLEALSGKADTNHDGIVTLKEVDLYVSRETNAYVRENYKKTQRPSIKGEMEGDLPLAEAMRLTQITFPRDIGDLHLALDRLAEGGILTIQPGVHRISRPINLDKNIQLIGATGDPEDVTIESSGTGCLVITAEKARIQGLTFQVKTERDSPKEDEWDTLTEQQKEIERDLELASAVHIIRGNSVLNKCNMTSNRHSGVTIFGSNAAPTLIRCKVFGVPGFGITFNAFARGTLQECEAYNNGNTGIKVCNSSEYVERLATYYGLPLEKMEYSDDVPQIVACKTYQNGGFGFACCCNNAKGGFRNCDSYENEASGFKSGLLADPLVLACKIHGNKMNGIDAFGESKGTFENCEVYDNAIDGIQVSDNSAPKVTGCKFYQNKETGIWVYDGGKGTFDNCEAYGNALSGIAVKDNGEPKVIRCKFYNNKDGDGIFVYEGGKGTFDNCEAYGNALNGIEVKDNGEPTIRNCTIRNNKYVGIYIHDGGRGTYERNTLLSNTNGSWDVRDNPGPFRRTGNRPNQ